MDGAHRKRKNRFSDAAAGGERPAKASLTQNPAALAKEAAAKIAQALPGVATSTPMSEKELIALEQRQRADLIFKSVQQQMTHIQSLLRKPNESNSTSPFLPAPLLLNEQGQEIDQHGNLVVDTTPSSVATLRVNQVTTKKVSQNPYLSHRVVEKDDKLEIADPRLKLKKRETRATKSLSFVQKGTIVKQGEHLRAREAKKVLDGFASGRNPRGYVQESIVSVEEDNNGNSDMTTRTSESMHTYDVPICVVFPIPDVEWWDLDYLPRDMTPLFDKMGFIKSMARKENPEIQVKYTDMKLKYCGTSHVIEHPARMNGLGAGSDKTIVLPLMLTALERKKIRRNNRAEREREKQDKIALGLMPPPEPKVKFSNMMKVLGEQAVADPSAVERKVRLQIAQREKNHEMRNLARKLTPEERRAKKLRKIKEDAAGDIHVAVFRLPDLSNPQHRFKVDVNAQQYHLTGGVLICKDDNINVIVVEGGRKAIKHYVHLLTKRINWGEVDDDDLGKKDDPQQTADGDKCVLAWQGVVARRAFNNFRFQECRTSTTARKVMETKGVAHYWDLAEKSILN